MQESWTIAELTELAVETLAATDPAGPPSGAARADGRIRDVPNERLVRWYGTVGLVDPPLSRRGRVARYGRRHLLQLVAVKRRQAEGRSLAEIQAELTGATDETLAAVARVPDIQPAPEASPAAPARFWTRQAGQLAPDADQHVPENGRPDEATSDPDQPDAGRAVAGADRRGRGGRWVAAAAGGDRGGRAGGTPPAGRSAAPAGGIVHGVRLAPGVTLLLEGADREPGAEDVTGIVNAARPLLEELAERGLRLAAGDVTGPSAEVGTSPRKGGHDH
jgi:DNA-binding transcriptional MerR regulator